MTPPVVLDASAALAVALGEPPRARVVSSLVRAVSDGGTVLVPDHFWLEFVNVLVKRHRWTGDAVLEAVHLFDTFEPRTVPVDRPMLLAALDLTERHRLTPYDATYLAIAAAEDAWLLTLDVELAAAAVDRAMPAEPGHRLHEPPAVYEHEVTWPRYKEAAAYLAKLRADALRDYERESPSAVPGPRR